MEALVELTYGVTLNHMMTVFCVVDTLQLGLVDTNTVSAVIHCSCINCNAVLQCCSNNTNVYGTACILSNVSLLQDM